MPRKAILHQADGNAAIISKSVVSKTRPTEKHPCLRLPSLESLLTAIERATDKGNQVIALQTNPVTTITNNKLHLVEVPVHWMRHEMCHTHTVQQFALRIHSLLRRPQLHWYCAWSTSSL
jgi:hypothetical protein